ncbi:MAG: alpha/beta hydrolase [Candidatus Bipolaricaulota bacterium]|nr:alpha/beta hydrolase [Candidatus Bipolaricaulota bacterium]
MRRVLWVVVAVAVASVGSAQPSPPYAFQAYTDIAYYAGPDADPVKHRLDLFVPEGVKDVPVLLFVHGGGWTSGDKNLYSFIGRAFAEQGFATAVVNYRLSPKVQHPAHIEDVARAFSWVHKNIAQYGGDPEKIFVMGHSSGGHLIALLALDEKYLRAHDLPLAAIEGAIPISGIYDVTIEPPAPVNIYRVVFGTDPQVRRDASPITHVGPNKPPFLIMYAQFDFPGFDAQARQLLSLLKQYENDAALVEIPGRDHVTIIFNIGAPGDRTTEEVLKFLRRR